MAWLHVQDLITLTATCRVGVGAHKCRHCDLEKSLMESHIAKWGAEIRTQGSNGSPQSVVKESWAGYGGLSPVLPTKINMGIPQIIINQVRRKTYLQLPGEMPDLGASLCPVSRSKEGPPRPYFWHLLSLSPIPGFFFFRCLPPINLPPLQRPSPSHCLQWKL